jgi:hypothetical protein
VPDTYADLEILVSEDASQATRFSNDHMYKEDMHADDGMLEGALDSVNGALMHGVRRQRE